MLYEFRHLLVEIDLWTLVVPDTWKPKIINVGPLKRSKKSLADHALAYFRGTELLSYSDDWFASLWNFHAACQILLRQSIIHVTNYYAKVELRELHKNEEASIEQQKKAIQKLSASIVMSLPLIIGLTTEHGEPSAPLSQGKMAGRFQAIFAMDVIQNNEYTTFEHKRVVCNMRRWVFAKNSIS